MGDHVLNEANVLCRRAQLRSHALPGSWHTRGVLAARQYQYPLAIAYLTGAASLDPTNASHLLELGDVLCASGRCVEALTYYQRALEPHLATHRPIAGLAPRS